MTQPLYYSSNSSLGFLLSPQSVNPPILLKFQSPVIFQQIFLLASFGFHSYLHVNYLQLEVFVSWLKNNVLIVSLAFPPHSVMASKLVYLQINSTQFLSNYQVLCLHKWHKQLLQSGNLILLLFSTDDCVQGFHLYLCLGVISRSAQGSKWGIQRLKLKYGHLQGKDPTHSMISLKAFVSSNFHGESVKS